MIFLIKNMSCECNLEVHAIITFGRMHSDQSFICKPVWMCSLDSSIGQSDFQSQSACVTVLVNF